MPGLRFPIPGLVPTPLIPKGWRTRSNNPQKEARPERKDESLPCGEKWAGQHRHSRCLCLATLPPRFSCHFLSFKGLSATLPPTSRTPENPALPEESSPDPSQAKKGRPPLSIPRVIHLTPNTQQETPSNNTGPAPRPPLAPLTPSPPSFYLFLDAFPGRFHPLLAPTEREIRKGDTARPLRSPSATERMTSLARPIAPSLGRSGKLSRRRI